MAILFRRRANPLQVLKGGQWENDEERDALIEEVKAAAPHPVASIGWMLVDRNPLLRRAGYEMLVAAKAKDTFAYFARAWASIIPAARASLARALPEMCAPGWENELAELLGNKNPKVVEVAFDMMMTVEQTALIRDLLVRMLEHEDARVRNDVMMRLLRDKDPSQLALFEKHARWPDEVVRMKILETLGGTRDARYLELLAERLEKDTYTIQQHLVQVFVTYAEAGHDVTTHVLPLLSGGDSTLRHAALKILTQMPDQERVVREFIDYTKDFVGWVRRRALESMAEFGDLLIEPIIHLLEDPDPDIRSTAINLAAEVKPDERVAEALAKLLNDEDWWVRINAAETLGAVGTPNSVPHLVRLLDTPDTRWSALDALTRLKDPRCLPNLMKLLQDPEPEFRVEAIKAVGEFREPRSAQALKHICEHDPNLEVRSEALRVLKHMAEEKRIELDEGYEKAVDYVGGVDVAKLSHIERLLLRARELQASDMHISVGHPPLVRLAADLEPLEGEEVLDDDATLALLEPVLTEAQQAQLMRNWSIDICYEVPNQGRYRASIFIDRLGLNAVFRVIPNQIPTLADIRMPPHLAEITHWHQGMVLIVGPASSGKTTTLAAFINLVNEARSSHILTIEDPIEFVHHYKSSLVNQRQIGRDTHDYHSALRAALREDPDIIVVGEMRDAETIRLAMEAAETGHLLIATINGTSAPRAIDRLINGLPPEEQEQCRAGIADNLRAVIAQRLVPRADGKGRVALFEVLMGCPTVAAVIREDRGILLPSLMQTGRSLGMVTVDDALANLLQRDLIDGETAYLRAQSKKRFEAHVSQEFMDSLNI